MHRDHVWSYDFVMERTSEGHAFRMLSIVDECSHERIVIDGARKLTSEDVLERLSDPFVRRGFPEVIRSDSCQGIHGQASPGVAGRVGVMTLSIEPGSPWENGYVDNFTRFAAANCWSGRSSTHSSE